ncbi:patatin-like phospholipase family protein [Roseateles sp.]|jgi:predicted acylesterase/phospholipase RssA|uniref:patatin-like phospholipase family protein n=1 Tax=Roseateles sp. TaxID=1971397 RepID=UPI0037C74ADF
MSKSSSRRRPPQAQPRIGLALAGGGPLGAIYEIGALCAIQESIDGLDLTRCDSYIGVSAGGFIAAALVNGMTPRQICAAFIENSAPPPDSFDPSVLLHPAWDEYLLRLRSLPALLGEALWQRVVERRSLLGAFERLGRALPTGLLSGEKLAEQVHLQFSQKGRSDDFRKLRRRLVLVATDLDSGESVPFGMPGHDHVPISRAVQASAALPGLFPPVEIEGRHYVDGALKRTIHASVLLNEGLDLLICLNPLVPYQAHRAGEAAAAAPHANAPPIPRMVDGGLPVVLSQTLRSLIHSRLELGMRGYAHSHPETDILLFEPDPRDPELFLANTFSYSQRRHLAEHAYQATRALLLKRHVKLQHQLAPHGLGLRMDVLHDPQRRLLAEKPLPGCRLEQALQRLDHSLRTLEARQQA